MNSTPLKHTGYNESAYQAAIIKLARSLAKAGVSNPEHAAAETMAMYRHQFRTWEPAR